MTPFGYLLQGLHILFVSVGYFWGCPSLGRSTAYESHKWFGLYLGCVALSQWLLGGQLYDDNHNLMAFQVGRKDMASNHWLDTTLPPIMCGIGPLKFGIDVLIPMTFLMCLAY